MKLNKLVGLGATLTRVFAVTSGIEEKVFYFFPYFKCPVGALVIPKENRFDRIGGFVCLCSFPAFWKIRFAER